MLIGHYIFLDGKVIWQGIAKQTIYAAVSFVIHRLLAKHKIFLVEKAM